MKLEEAQRLTPEEREAISGVNRIREVGNTRVALATTISKLNLDAIEPMAKLAKDLRVQCGLPLASGHD